MLRRPLVSLFLFIQLFVSAYALALPANFSVSPDNSQRMLISTVRRAEKTLDINIYMITSKALERVIVDRVNAGVVVNMLVEAQPYGDKIVSVEKELLDRLKAAFDQQGKSRLLVMTDKPKSSKRRFVFNHAKYVIVDGSMAYISSENFVGSGAMSYPDSKGNRGWQVMLLNRTVAQDLLKIFRADTDTRQGDVFEYDPSLVDLLPPLPPGNFDPSQNRRTLTPFAAGQGDVAESELCLSPKALRCLTDFMKTAKTTLDVQHLSLPLYWPSVKKEKILNPLIGEMLAAARRGVKVRVMISPSSAHGDDGEKKENKNAPPPYVSKETIEFVREIAKRERLAIEITEINTENLQLKILHNKGMIADGERVFVGSINGTENSVSNNREVGVAMKSTDAAKYFGEIYDFDWKNSN